MESNGRKIITNVQESVMSQKSNTERTITHVFCFLLAIWPVLNIYGFLTESIGVGDLFIIPISVYAFFCVIGFSGKISKSFTYTTFFGAYLVISLFALCFVNIGNAYGITLSISKTVMYVFCFSVVAPKMLDIRVFLKHYRRIAIFLSLIIFVQFVLAILGNTAPFVINSKVFLIRDVDGYSNFLRTWSYNVMRDGFRPSSLFTEPAKYAQYVCPCLLLSLMLEGENKKRYFFEIFISVAVLLSMSANGAIYCLLSWGLWFVFGRGESSKNMKIVVSIIGTLAMVYLFFGNGTDNWLIGRLSEIGSGTINSGNMRVLRGWIIFKKLPSFNKLVGVGIANAAHFIEYSGITTNYDGGYIGYMSGLSEIAVTGGILSLVMYILYFIKNIKNRSLIAKTEVILMTIMIASSATLNNPSFGIIVALIEYSRIFGQTE